jgi:hypothetical protein
MRRRTLVAGLIVGSPILGIGSCIMRDDAIEARFERVQVGMSPAEVVHIMGKPDADEKCGELVPFLSPSKMSDCTMELVYSPTAPIVTPGDWVIWFDHSGHVKATEELQSP